MNVRLHLLEVIFTSFNGEEIKSRSSPQCLQLMTDAGLEGTLARPPPSTINYAHKRRDGSYPLLFLAENGENLPRLPSTWSVCPKHLVR